MPSYIIRCNAICPDDKDVLCAINFDFNIFSRHSGPHGWELDPPQVASATDDREKLREHFPHLVDRLDQLEREKD